MSPAIVVIDRSTLPGRSTPGAVAVISVSESTVKLAAGSEPNFTAEALSKFLPAMVSTVPPVTEPEFGVTEAISGTGRTSALSSISLPLMVSLGGTTVPSNGVGKIEAKLGRRPVSDLRRRVADQVEQRACLVGRKEVRQVGADQGGQRLSEEECGGRIGVTDGGVNADQEDRVRIPFQEWMAPRVRVGDG